MSAGVPVITSGVGGQAWIVRDGSNGVVLDGPDDIQGATDAIITLADSPRLRRKLGREASRTASPYSLTRLVDALARRLRAELLKHSDDSSVLKTMPDDERVIEAWVHNGQRVAATSKRLIVRPAEKGKAATSVPYQDISKIVPHSEAPWAVLVVGAVATMLLVLQRMIGLDLLRPFLSPAIFSALSTVGLSEMTPVMTGLLPLLPVITAGAIFFLAMNRGYMVQYGSSHTLFLPRKFGKALKLAGKLTPGELATGDSDHVPTTVGKPS